MIRYPTPEVLRRCADIMATSELSFETAYNIAYSDLQWEKRQRDIQEEKNNG